MSDNATAIIFLILTPIGIILTINTYYVIRLKYMKLLGKELEKAVENLKDVKE